MKNSIAAAFAVVEVVLQLDVRYDPADPDCVDEADSLTIAATHLELNIADLLEVLVFARTILHNKLVAARTDDQDLVPEELASMLLLAELLDQVPDIYFDVDPAVADRTRCAVHVSVPMCLTYASDRIHERATEYSKYLAREFARQPATAPSKSRRGSGRTNVGQTRLRRAGSRQRGSISASSEIESVMLGLIRRLTVRSEPYPR